MRTMPRLTRAYRNARLLEIDSSSKIVIFSDSHRGDGSLADEFHKDRDIFEAALQHYLDEEFTLIEAGDNDELWEYSKFHHILKANPEVFQLIRQFHLKKRYIRIYGNHDMQLRDPQYVREHLYLRLNHVTGRAEPLLDGTKVEEAVLLRHKDTGQEILTVHGHQGDFPNDQAWRASMLTFRVFWRHLHALGIHSPSSPTRNSYRRHKVERNYVRWILEHGTALICGHTHRERFPMGDDAPLLQHRCVSVSRLHHRTGDRERHHQPGQLADYNGSQWLPACGAQDDGRATCPGGLRLASAARQAPPAGKVTGPVAADRAGVHAPEPRLSRSHSSASG
ncbi:hypothetical protein [Brooklawnia sp.]|uniref:hypothetical protein n=1 Tax=Brooklawnia sp. TaxID=2699740 RepID=UPI00311F3604